MMALLLQLKKKVPHF